MGLLRSMARAPTLAQAARPHDTLLVPTDVRALPMSGLCERTVSQITKYKVYTAKR